MKWRLIMTAKALPIYKTPTAERKIIEIAKWSATKWGRKTALEYLKRLNKTISLVAEGILPTQKNEKFSRRFSFCQAEQHYIFFEILHDKIIIATLFHTATHIKERIKDEQSGLQQEIVEMKR